MPPKVLIHVDRDELDRAAAFYARAFGLLVGRRLQEDLVELLGADTAILLHAQRQPEPVAAVPLDLRVEDLEATLSRAAAAGASLEGRVREHAWGRAAELADPFGNRVCLFAFHRRAGGLAEAPAAWQGLGEGGGEPWARAS